MSHPKMHVIFILLLWNNVTNLHKWYQVKTYHHEAIYWYQFTSVDVKAYHLSYINPHQHHQTIFHRHVLQATLVPALDTICKTIKQYPTNVINGMDPWEKTTTLALPFLPCLSYSFSTVLWWFEVLGESWYFTTLKQVSHLGGYNYTKVTLFFFKVVFGPGMSRNNTAVIFFAIVRLCNRLWSAAKG